jgi:acyl carrier protein
MFGNPKLELFDQMTAQDVKGWDSLAHIDLVVAIEKHFKIKLATGDVVDLKNVGELIAVIEKRVGR